MPGNREVLMARLTHIRKVVSKLYLDIRGLSADNLHGAVDGGGQDLDVPLLYRAQDDILALNQTLMEVQDACNKAAGK
jgi:hypothetical protein